LSEYYSRNLQPGTVIHVIKYEHALFRGQRGPALRRGSSPSREVSAPAQSPAVRHAAWGLLNQKPRWSLSWRGWLLALFACVAFGTTALLTIYPFLAVTHREPTNVLVVEGWVNQATMRVAADEIRNGSYQQVFTTGGPVEGLGGYVSDYSTAANVGAGLLRKAGVPEELIHPVPSHVSGRDRTYNSAVALKNWLREHNVSVRAVNVLTEGAHARRTRLLFQEAVGTDIAVGIISVSSPDYDRKHWWRYSEGVREVVGETIAYVYAKFLFWPQHSENVSE
jgi:DUF218 domain